MSVGENKALKWLRSRVALGVRPGLERMRDVLKALGNPETKLSFVHVAGTNGKGSVCAILTSLLGSSLRVGTFTSPGFDGWRGTFSVTGQTVSSDQFAKIAADVMAAEAKATPADPLTEFEALTIMAILYFVEACADVVVWEAGLGGRLDSTNVVTPVVSVITNVSRDHEELLGDTISAIAEEKAGIIKTNIPVVTGTQDSALAVVQRTAVSRGAQVFQAGISFSAVTDAYDGAHQLLTYHGISQDFYRLPFGLLGSYQRENAGIALAVYELLVQRKLVPAYTPVKMRRAFQNIHWNLRFEVFWKGNYPVVLDGAHNRAAASGLSQSLKELSQLCRIDSPWFMIVGVLEDKDIDTMIDIMLPWLQNVIVCEPDNERALSVSILTEKLRQASKTVRVVAAPSVSDAVVTALDSEQPVCCWGSLYTAAEARKTIHEIIGDS